MLVRAYVSERFQSIGYVVIDVKTGIAAAVDAPPGTGSTVSEIIRTAGCNLTLILNTHGHWDHCGGNAELARTTGATICAHSWDWTRLAHPELTITGALPPTVEPSTPGSSLQDGSVIEVGSIKLEVLHTPGHSPGSVCLYNAYEGVLFSGDTLLKGSVGPTNMAGGNRAHMETSLQKLAGLPDKTRVYPGRGTGTTIKDERWLLSLAG